MNDRIILHCDMNAFFASVELLDFPEYKELPVAICGDPKNRHGIILAKNEHAKKYNVKTAETIYSAKRKCPNLICLPPHMDKYKKYSRLMNELYLSYTDMVEPFSIDESWLDVTASQSLFGDGEKIANEIREKTKSKFGLTLSAGVSFNKIFAKMGSKYKKPDATTVISRENYKDIIWPLDISEMFFVGKATAEKLKNTNIKTIGDLAKTDEKFLTSLLGKYGKTLYEYANGLDNAPVALYTHKEQAKSIGHATTFSADISSEDEIKTALYTLTDKVATRLRKSKLRAYSIKIDIKDSNFKVFTKQRQLQFAINTADDLSKNAMLIIKSFWPSGKPIRLLSVTAINLVNENESEQLSMFEGSASVNRKKNEAVERTVDDIRKKYGKEAIKFGRGL